MFRRKEEENSMENENTTEVKPSQPAASPVTSAAPVAASAPVMPRPVTPEPKMAPITPSQPTPAYRPAAPQTPARPANFATPSSSGSETAGKRRILTVGNDILLKGEIATCDRLVIEGAVDAKLNEVHTVEIAQTGSFKGSAEIEDAEISGLFEGDLVVRNRLIIYSTGKVRGKITYGEIEIERGGELTGEIKTVKSAGETSANKEAKTKAA